MKHNSSDNLRNKMKLISMTSLERGQIRDKLIAYARRPIASPWYFVFRPVGVIALIIAVIAGGTVSLSYASNAALPTDKLYPIKLLTEEVVLAAKKTPAEKADYQVTRVAKRLDEATTLAKQKKLTPTISHQIAEQVTAHVADTNASIKENAAVDPKQALAAATALETTLEVKSAELVSTIETDQTSSKEVATARVEQTTDSMTATSFDAGALRPDTRSELASVLLTVTETVTENKKELDKTKTIVVESLKQTDIGTQKDQAETALSTIKKELGPLTSEPVTAKIAPDVTAGTQVSNTAITMIAPAPASELRSDIDTTQATSIAPTETPKESAKETSSATQKTTEIKALLQETQELFNKGEYAESLVKSEKIKSLIEVKAETTQTIQIEKK